MLTLIRKHLAWKLFLSYLVVIIVGVIVLATATELSIPRSFSRHMGETMGGMMSLDMGSGLFSSFRAAVTEALFIATMAAISVAVVAGVLVSRRIVAPVRSMMAASQRIAEGHYQDRVEIPGSQRPEEMDELAQLAVTFNQMAAKLDRTEAMRRELIGDVAHELRTPLATIKGSMEGLMDGVVAPEPSAFHQIYQEADRLQHLVADLQELSRIEAGSYQLELNPVPVDQLIEAVKARLQSQYAEKNVSLEVESTPVRLLVDEDRIGQVLLNLVGNALQYTAPGGRVRILVRTTADQAEIRVADTGIGISKEHLPHLFTRFYRVDKSRSRAGGGSGIGLTISKHLVEAHGGTITAKSPGLGQGSVFSIHLPLAA
jgi:histidine kinase